LRATCYCQVGISVAVKITGYQIIENGSGTDVAAASPLLKATVHDSKKGNR